MSEYSYFESLVLSLFAGVFPIIYFGLMVLMVASLWVLFSKAGEPGWAALIPIYNTYTMLKIAGRPWYWLLLYLVPLVNIVIGIIALNDFLKAYGKGGVGSFLLTILFPIIYLPYLAFSSSVQYVGQ